MCEKKFKHKNTCTVHIKVKVKNSSSSIAYQDSVGSELFYHIRMHDSDPDPAVDFYKILQILAKFPDTYQKLSQIVI